MVFYILKVLLSSVIILVISEISKRSSLLGSIFASIPLVSVLAIIWIYMETKDIQKIEALSSGIFWLVIPSLVFFILLPYLLRRHVDFWPSMGISAIVMIIFYFIMIFALEKFGIKL